MYLRIEDLHFMSFHIISLISVIFYLLLGFFNKRLPCCFHSRGKDDPKAAGRRKGSQGVVRSVAFHMGVTCGNYVVTKT